MKPVLDTLRLVLREMSLDDLDFIAAMLANPEVMRFYPKIENGVHGRDEVVALAWRLAGLDIRAQAD